MRRVYLDHSATTQVDEEVAELIKFIVSIKTILMLQLCHAGQKVDMVTGSRVVPIYR